VLGPLALLSLLRRILELQFSLCLVEGELYHQYWFYVTLTSKKLFMFSSRSLGKRTCVLHVDINKPYKIPRKMYFLWVLGSGITSVALQKSYFLKRIIPLLLKITEIKISLNRHKLIEIQHNDF